MIKTLPVSLNNPTTPILSLTGLAQNIRTTKEVSKELHYQTSQPTSLNNSKVNILSRNSSPGFFDWKERWNQHPTRKIITGSIFILLGAEGITEAFIPETNYEDPSNFRINRIGIASISAILLSSGTVLLIKGINLRQQNKLKVTTSKNGIGLIYRI